MSETRATGGNGEKMRSEGACARFRQENRYKIMRARGKVDTWRGGRGETSRLKAKDDVKDVSSARSIDRHMQMLSTVRATP